MTRTAPITNTNRTKMHFPLMCQTNYVQRLMAGTAADQAFRNAEMSCVDAMSPQTT